MKALILGVVFGLGVAGCGGGISECQTTNCPPPSAKMYQICATAGSTVVTQNYGGQSCTIDAANPQTPAAMACAQAIAAWCAKP
jgi:hypothetical protein